VHPELFEIPFTHLTVKSYGLMMVIAFLAAIFVIKRLSRNITPDAQLITNGGLYALIAGVVGARVFYVIHYFDRFQSEPIAVFAVWEGGLELLGGVILALVVILFYLRHHKLPVRRYLDVLAIGLMAALAFGRIGCFLNGCCFGKPADVPWAVRFPYDSLPYRSQVRPDPDRNRLVAQLKLPSEFFGYVDADGRWVQVDGGNLKPLKMLTKRERQMLLEQDKLRSLPVHPTELYSSLNGAVLCLILYFFWRRYQKPRKTRKLLAKPGSTFALMFILYGVVRFLIEWVRDDNPFEYGWWTIYKGGTISQNLCIYLVILGLILMAVFQRLKPDKISVNALQSVENRQ